MPFFRKKPVVIEAHKVSALLHAAEKSWQLLPKSIIEAYDKGNVLFYPDYVSISTLEGIMKAGKEDWIIRGVQGEIYPCKPDIFKQTYEEVIPEELA